MSYDSLTKGNLTITAAPAVAVAGLTPSDDVLVRWVGRSDERDPAEFLSPYLTKLAGVLGGKRVRVDFSQLDYMNSSTIKPVIRFVQALASQAAGVAVQYNASQKWQSISFDALRTVFMPLKNVTVSA